MLNGIYGTLAFQWMTMCCGYELRGCQIGAKVYRLKRNLEHRKGEMDCERLLKVYLGWF